MVCQFKNSCVDTPRHEVKALSAMIDSNTDITRRTFLKHVDREELKHLEADLGYAQHPSHGLTMANNWHVSYHRSKWNGRRCYYFCWSGIEHYFV